MSSRPNESIFNLWPRTLAQRYIQDHAVRRCDVGRASGKGQHKKWLPSALLRAASFDCKMQGHVSYRVS